ncbi:3-phosphoglycerate dehydrogenase [Alkalihalobacillus alcalophilus ATCC 27647 = CGMCC 1.3604]|uniref:3-phosphoglycerate dehydrogenase n=1 Tax=Alkalihalobacillus alcalophilus ATCC 27647 = CGMCC 1.3604 TaxID=1218173 RepID=A0A094XFW5_ALKAL|nr:D-2-hydroxyacid dehydrogenase [Alkalihalobacillus alcalophilus]KGA97680.1 3-phosphoglycerate dehydrogenase [Alkalihalobacillus alcalophilus ATCC 27647 = CGMCC 1.3604]MED1562553.1 D-2-hydroxyacid dehydrogenase [Alkalihalobacillus alcalophilus]THG91290.1 3-phosphoglycerate dehydrogenase [Alkalihalobacillus alcalophilus ATCC 27647 = CGMCC 1.3604]
MKIISSAQIATNIQKDLETVFPEAYFSFYNNMAEAEDELRTAEILITYGEDLEEKHIQTANKLKWVMVISAGLEQLPFDALKKKGILVTNCRGIHAKPMAEYTIGMMLQVARKTKTLIEQEQAHDWNRSVPMIELNGKTISILGVGAIGQEIARLAKAFNMNVLGMNSSGQEVENVDQVVSNERVEEILTVADFVVNVLPATEETKEIMNEQRFRKMKRSATFINIGRGYTVDENALIKIMTEGAIEHAVLDVFWQEPLANESPFWDMNNVTVTPHLSGISSSYQPRAFQIFRENLKKYINQEKHENFINRINLNKGY